MSVLNHVCTGLQRLGCGAIVVPVGGVPFQLVQDLLRLVDDN